VTHTTRNLCISRRGSELQWSVWSHSKRTNTVMHPYIRVKHCGYGHMIAGTAKPTRCDDRFSQVQCDTCKTCSCGSGCSFYSRLHTQRLVACDGRERQASDTDLTVCSVVAVVSGGIVACPVRGGSPGDGDLDTTTCLDMYLRVEAGRSSTTVSQFSFKNDGRKWWWRFLGRIF
jgi:hypothetical protein